MAFYLKYRPQKIGELDNENVREILLSVLTSKDPPHAYLFTGPKGLGKTSSARLVAKALNCIGKKEKDVEPCNTCDLCVSITNGTSLDILEIDAASNRGIDEIRELREKIRLAPVTAKKKVYIIDEVHMLTTEAFNALLKTLEEPPRHAVFILATTEPHKVPDTIISRCLHIPFHKATEVELVRSLKRIVKGEDISVEPKVLEYIASLADGGFRDAAKILEEMVSLSKDKMVNLELLEKRFHTRSIKSAAQELLVAFAKKDTKKGFELINKLSQEGVDFTYFLEQLHQILHKILLVKSNIEKDQSMSELSSLFAISDLSALFTLFSKASYDMKYSVIPQLPLELSLIEWTTEHSSYESDEVSTPQKTYLKDDGVTVKSLRKTVGNIVKKQILEPVSTEKPPVEKKETNVNLLSFKATGDLTEEWMGEFWDGIIHKMKDYNHTLAGVLRGCKIRSFDRKTLVIETKFKFHKDRLSEEKTLTALEDVCKHLTGNKIAVLVELTGN